MGRKKKEVQDARLVFPWEAKAGKGKATPEPRVAPEAEEDSAGPGQFRGEHTREYRLPDSFEAPASRSEVAMDSPRAREDTTQVILPLGVAKQKRPEHLEYDEAEWPEQKTFRDTFRRRLYADPAVRWFFSLPAARRQVIVRAAWILGACWMIIGIFMWSSMVIYPILEEHLRPSFAPKPGKPVRNHPRHGLTFDLVEERTYDARKFKMGIDCVWVTRQPGSEQRIVPERVSLVYGDETVATLDMRVNWNGQLRFYFGVGEVIPNSPMYVKIPIENGGMWLVDRSPGYGVFSQGGPIPAFYLVGPVFFGAGE